MSNSISDCHSRSNSSGGEIKILFEIDDSLMDSENTILIIVKFSIPIESVVGKVEISSERSAKLTGVAVETNYTRERKVTLPSDDTDLATDYSSQDNDDVEVDNGVRVDIEGQSGYLLHQFKDMSNNDTNKISVSWNGQTSLAPNSSTVYLQIYNRTTTLWETLDSNSTEDALTDFTLQGGRALSLSDYYDGSNWISCRVYQLIQ